MMALPRKRSSGINDEYSKNQSLQHVTRFAAPEIGGGPASVVTLGFSQTLSYAHQGTHGDPFVSSPFADAEQPWSRGWRAHVTTWHLEINRQEKTSDW
jgi:hypothetical protein